MTDAWTQPELPPSGEKIRLVSSLPCDTAINLPGIKVSADAVRIARVLKEGPLDFESDFKKHAELRYTTDGSVPTKDSPSFAPFTMKPGMPVTVGAILYDVCVMTNLYRYWRGEVTVPKIYVTTNNVVGDRKWEVAISNETSGAVMYYTIDGSEPTAGSTRYVSPFTVEPPAGETVLIRVVALKDEWRSATAEMPVTCTWTIADGMGSHDQTFTTGGVEGWIRDKDGYDGGESLRSAMFSDGTNCWIETVVTNVGTGTISFWWKASCEKSDTPEPSWDHAEFSVDGVRIASLDGQTDWCEVTSVITNVGEHTLRWTYMKDGSDSAGQDCIWLSQFSWADDGSLNVIPGLTGNLLLLWIFHVK